MLLVQSPHLERPLGPKERSSACYLAMRLDFSSTVEAVFCFSKELESFRALNTASSSGLEPCKHPASLGTSCHDLLVD